MAVNVHYNDGYTTMCNHHLRDVSLSWQAKGMLSFMFSNREDFKYSINGLTKCASNGDTSVRSILNELKEKGYLIVTPVKGINGRIECWDYDFFETPDDAKQFEGRPHVENTHVENQGQRNTNISSTNSRINTPISPITKKRNTNISSPSIPQGEVIEELSQEKILFEEFRKAYLGTKRGLDIEFTNFCKKHKDWRDVLPYLKVNYERQIEAKKSQRGSIDPRYEKHLQTYINQRCWEEEISYGSNTPTNNHRHEAVSATDKARQRAIETLRANGYM
jgi:hypothetical protein